MFHLIELRAMGCQVTVQLDSESESLLLLEKVAQEIAHIEAQLSRFLPDSELSQLNANAGKTQRVSKLLFENIKVARQAALLTDGLYNPLVLPALIASGYDKSFEQIGTVQASDSPPIADWQDIKLNRDTQSVYIPPESTIDLGGITKGWTAQYLADELSEHGACLVNMGGDMVGRGEPDGFSGWQVDIEDPFTGDVFTSVVLHDSSIATSGIDFRQWQDTKRNHYHHIIDPRTGKAADSDVLTVTVIHPHAPTAEAYAKAVLILGAEAGLNWLNQQWHTAGLVFTKDGSVLSSSTFTPLIPERITYS